MSVLILPNQLFEHNYLIKKYPSQVIIYEHPKFFTSHEYHKQKLMLHRATMKYYADYIHQTHGSKITYLEYHQKINFDK